MIIPKTIHQIWIGNDPIPDTCKAFIEQWKAMYSDYNHILWDDSRVKITNIIPDDKQKYFMSAYPIALRADILRYEIVRRFGGIYIDVDTEPLKRMEDYMLNCRFFGGKQSEHQIAIGIFGAEPRNELINDVCATVVSNIEDKLASGCGLEWVDQLTGPMYFTRRSIPYRSDPSYYFYNMIYFYPYSWLEPHRRHENFKITSPDAYSVHHWQKRWL